MASRIDNQKKQKVLKLYYEGAKVGHIAICTRLKTTTVQDLIQRERKRVREHNRAAGNQDVGPSLEEIHAERDRIRESWPEDERLKRLSSAYRPQSVDISCDQGGRRWNGEVMG